MNELNDFSIVYVADEIKETRLPYWIKKKSHNWHNDWLFNLHSWDELLFQQTNTYSLIHTFIWLFYSSGTPEIIMGVGSAKVSRSLAEPCENLYDISEKGRKVMNKKLRIGLSNPYRCYIM